MPARGPRSSEVELAAVARGFGCPARRITTHDELAATLDELVPTLEERDGAAAARRRRRPDAGVHGMTEFTLH